MTGRTRRGGWAVWRMLAVILGFWLLAGGTAAQEVAQTIGHLSAADGALRLELEINAEAFLAGADLDAGSDISESDAFAAYRHLRKTPAPALEAQVRDFAVEWSRKLKADANGPISWSYEGARVPVIGDPGQERISHLLFTGALPDGARSVELTWPVGAGVLVLRQQGVPAPYTGYLQGGETSPAIPLDGGASRPPREAFILQFKAALNQFAQSGATGVLVVLALFFLSARARPLVLQSLAFVLGTVLAALSSASALIASDQTILQNLLYGGVTILALDNIFTRKLRSWRSIAVLGAGFVQGLILSALALDAGLMTSQVLPALAGYNAGFVLAQLVLLAVLFLTAGLWFRDQHWYRGRIAVPVSVVLVVVCAIRLLQAYQMI